MMATKNTSLTISRWFFIYLLLSVLGITSRAHSQEKAEFPELHRLKGGIYMVEQTVHQIKGFLRDSSIVIGELIATEKNMRLLFDNKKNITHISFYPENKDEDTLYVKYLYHKNGLCTQKKVSLENLGTVREVSYTYTPEKKIHTEIYIEDGEKVEKWLYHYNKKGLNDRITIYEYLGNRENISEVRSMTYNKKGFKIREKRKTTSSKEVYRYQFTYNHKGQKVKEIWFDEQARVSDVWKYTYAGENLVKEIWTGPAKKEEVNLYKYNSKNELIAHSFKSRYSKKAQKFFFKYLYDEKGNWTKKIFFHRDTKKKIYTFDKVILRKINYRS